MKKLWLMWRNRDLIVTALFVGAEEYRSTGMDGALLTSESEEDREYAKEAATLATQMFELASTISDWRPEE